MIAPVDAKSVRPARSVGIHQGELDEARMVEWVRQSAAIPGWPGIWRPSVRRALSSRRFRR